MDNPFFNSSSVASRNRSSRPSFSNASLPPNESRQVSSDFDFTPGIDAIVHVLNTSGIPGPAILFGPKKYLGQGKQFIVFRQTVALFNSFREFTNMTVAAKQPKFAILEEGVKRLSLTGKDMNKALKDIAIEIKALTYPALQHHPNIVRLVSWSFDAYNVHQPFTIAMELAVSDLGKFLQAECSSENFHQRLHFCFDIANGVDAIHDHELVHGDLKPGNILIFAKGDCLVAKLGDFGLSVEGSERLQKIGGTPGWQAPEVEQGRYLTARELKASDNYSFGLVIWSLIFNTCQDLFQTMEPVERQEWVATRLAVGDRDINTRTCHENHLLAAVKYAIPLLLRTQPQDRPLKLKGLLYYKSDATNAVSGEQLNTVAEPEAEPEASLSSQVTNTSDFLLVNRLLPWELFGQPDVFTVSLLPRFMKAQEDARPDILFRVYLEMTVVQASDESYTYEESPERFHGYSALDVLRNAAAQGYPPAQAAVAKAIKFFGQQSANETEQQLTAYYRDAIIHGSIHSRGELGSMEGVEAVSNPIQQFRSNGGYMKFYSPQLAQEVHATLHSVIRFQGITELKTFLDTHPSTDINERTEGEFPLYIACARGSWEVTMELLDRGARYPSASTNFQITCLHWAFAFDASIQQEVIERLLKAGADINAMASHPVPLFHYPFSLPAGTALHWAIATESHMAIQGLVNHGADLSIRDGSDPYQYDHRVRVLGALSSIDQDASSFSETGTLGLSPMDYAAMNYCPFIFELLLDSQRKSDVPINGVDEEGFSVLHRLSTTLIRRKRLGGRFSLLPFKGSYDDLKEHLRRTVAGIKNLGGALEQFTTPMAAVAQVQQTIGQKVSFESYTPLMLAALSGRGDVVNALLEAGAPAGTKNASGITALHCMSEDNAAAFEIVRSLVSTGISVKMATTEGVTPLQVAAMRRNLRAVELLLEQGADIEDIDKNPKSMLHNASIFAHLARQNYSLNRFNESYDVQVAEIIEKNLTKTKSSPCRHIITRCDLCSKGKTLLYRFAEALMPHTVSALIRCGAEVNALSTIFTANHSGATTGTSILLKSPLDGAVQSSERNKSSMIKNMDLTTPEYNHLDRRAKDVIRILQEAMGDKSQDL